MPSRASGSATRMLHRPVGRRGGCRSLSDAKSVSLPRRPRARRPLRRLRGPPFGGGDTRSRCHRQPELEHHLLEHAEHGQDVVDVDVAEMADAQRLPGELALAAGDHEVALEQGAVERLPVHAVGQPRVRDGRREMGRVGEEPVAERLQPGAGRRRDGRMARGKPREPSRSIISSATSSWNITAIAGVKGVWPLAAKSRASARSK